MGKRKSRSSIPKGMAKLTEDQYRTETNIAETERQQRVFEIKREAHEWDNDWTNAQADDDAEVGRERRKQMSEWSAKGAREKTLYDAAEKAIWLEINQTLDPTHPAEKRATEIAERRASVIKEHGGDPNSAIETIRKTIPAARKEKSLVDPSSLPGP